MDMLSVRIVSRLALTLAAAALACSSGGGKGGGTTAPGAGSVTGFVMDQGTGVGLAGAAVSGGGATGSTDAKGYFTLTGLPAGQVTVTVTKSGYAPAYATPRSSDKPESTLVALKRQGTPQAYAPGTRQTLSQTTEAGPYAVTFAANSLDTTDTNLHVSITPVDPTKEASVLPGTLAISGQGILVPVTFAEFSILDSAGNRVQLKTGQTATVELPIPPSLRAQYPLATKIHCYAFNAASGAWEDFVDGTVITSTVDGTTPVLSASIRHFSWYGGAPVGTNCFLVYGRVVSAVGGSPLGNARVEATPGGTTYSDAAGGFAVATSSTAAVSFLAYQTGVDVSGALTGTPGAKYIEFGRADGVELAGLTLVSCASPPASVTAPPGLLGGPGDPVPVKVGTVAKAYYEVTAILSGDGSGTILVTVEQGVPDASGNLTGKTPVSGSKITVSGATSSALLAEVAAGTGFYGLPGGSPFLIEKGKTYQLSIDADGNGSVDGSGTASVVGDVTWTLPVGAGVYPASGFAPSWTDSGSSTAGYSAVYFVTIAPTGGAGSEALYIGTDRQFVPYDLVQGPGSPLVPGAYQATLAAYSGFAAVGSSYGITQAGNITGVGLSGTAYSVGTASPVDFTLQ